MKFKDTAYCRNMFRSVVRVLWIWYNCSFWDRIITQRKIQRNRKDLQTTIRNYRTFFHFRFHFLTMHVVSMYHETIMVIHLSLNSYITFGCTAAACQCNISILKLLMITYQKWCYCVVKNNLWSPKRIVIIKKQKQDFSLSL